MSSDGEHVGKISDIMLDVRNGRIAYAVLSEGGFLGMGSNRHAIPWSALTLDTDEQCSFVDITAQRLKDDPGFDKDHWPVMADAKWGNQPTATTSGSRTGQRSMRWWKATLASGRASTERHNR